MQTRVMRQLREFFCKEKRVLAVYTFGSEVSGRAIRGSDLDVAVLLDPGCVRRAFELEIEWREMLSRLLEREVDVVILNQADPFLRFQVYSKGMLVFSNDAKKAKDHKWKSVKEYWDWQPTQRILEGCLNSRQIRYKWTGF